MAFFFAGANGSLARPLHRLPVMRDGTASTAHAGPFRLTGCIELRGILSRRAVDERELRASPSILVHLTA
jgi:hypothetical protein